MKEININFTTTIWGLRFLKILFYVARQVNKYIGFLQEEKSLKINYLLVIIYNVENIYTKILFVSGESYGHQEIALYFVWF